MECNKQEAIRAKVIAEKKLLEKDFNGAKKVALKAQSLFPELENISQLLSVCEVHCAAGIKINGLADWYAILQVLPTADEISVKKQYRRLALSLHPDKNKFAGAEEAFKLIGEAHRTLTDNEKRSQYDVRRKNSVTSLSQKAKSQQVNPKSHSTVQPGIPTCFPKYSQQVSGAVYAYVNCPHCKAVNSLPLGNRNTTYMCLFCSKVFACDMSARQAPGAVPGHVKHPGPGASQYNWFPYHTAFKPTNFTSTGFSGQGSSKANGENHNETNASGMGTFSKGAFKATQGSQNAANVSATGLNGNMDGAGGSKGQPDVKFEEAKFANGKMREPAAKSSKIHKASTKKKTAKCSEDEFSDTESTDSDVIVQGAKAHSSDSGSASNENRRRSTRQRRNVTYAEDDDDDDLASHRKRSKVGSQCHDSCKNEGFSDANEINNNGKHKTELKTETNSEGPPKESSSSQEEESFEEETSSTGNASPVESCPSTFTYPDPEFHDFDHDRDASKFGSGQFWATYDDLDGMPRFYAKIVNVISSFKVRFTWLESSPGTKAEIGWSDAGLPIACGNFRLGDTEITDNRDMFSHLIRCQKGTKKIPYTVKPGSGEVWAVHKNWDINWRLDPDGHTSYEYEVVEILSEDDFGINAAKLYKVEEFVSVFARDIDAEHVNISSSEILRFSHMIPSYKIPLPEAESFCRVYYELDPAALPSNPEHTFSSVSLGVQLEHTLRQIKEKCSKAAAGQRENPASDGASDAQCEWLHNFELDKSHAKLAIGQIWALHCNVDGFPKYYAYISNVDVAGTKVTVRWLESWDDLEEFSPWLNNALPIACGKFKLSTSKGSKETLSTLEKFSHSVQFESNKRHQYNIYPHAGEVWALYRNWSIEWEESDMKSCEYDVVEVLSAGHVIRVALLMKADGQNNAIFAQKNEKQSVVTLDIPGAELLRFSHLVPSHRLTRGPWEGHWQLDPVCLPHNLL